MRVAGSRARGGRPWNLLGGQCGRAGPRKLANVESIDGSIAWSPDGTTLLVYGGSGGYLLDATTRDYDMISYVSGYGAVAWLPDQRKDLQSTEPAPIRSWVLLQTLEFGARSARGPDRKQSSIFGCWWRSFPWQPLAPCCRAGVESVGRGILARDI